MDLRMTIRRRQVAGSHIRFDFVNWRAGESSPAPGSPGDCGIAVFPLGRRVLLSSRRHTVDDRYADQTENSYPRSTSGARAGCERRSPPDNQYDLAGDVNPE